MYPLLSRIAKTARSAGTRTVYTALLLYYAYRRKETPGWAKRTILGALGYLIAPLDALPDLTPVLGYTDDLAVLGTGLAIVAAYINKDVRTQARAKLDAWFPGQQTAEVVEAVDRELD
ncbi:YkvA family protein [Neolewinella sp.]|uniref:YkvA family protein n=1 Tax=Neolewinella sp. TaxID=2993543 RepID=UPI003B522D5B